MIEWGELEQFYGGLLPDFAHVEVHNIKVDLDKSNITLRVDLEQLPTTPPKSWGDRRYTNFQIIFELLDIEDFCLIGWAWEPLGSMEIVESDDRIRVRFSPVPEVEIVARSMSILKLSPYDTWPS